MCTSAERRPTGVRHHPRRQGGPRGESTSRDVLGFVDVQATGLGGSYRSDPRSIRIACRPTAKLAIPLLVRRHRFRRRVFRQPERARGPSMFCLTARRAPPQPGARDHPGRSARSPRASPCRQPMVRPGSSDSSAADVAFRPVCQHPDRDRREPTPHATRCRSASTSAQRVVPRRSLVAPQARAPYVSRDRARGRRRSRFEHTGRADPTKPGDKRIRAVVASAAPAMAERRRGLTTTPAARRSCSPRPRYPRGSSLIERRHRPVRLVRSPIRSTASLVSSRRRSAQPRPGSDDPAPDPRAPGATGQGTGRGQRLGVSRLWVIDLDQVAYPLRPGNAVRQSDLGKTVHGT